ncbi:hypothetical protein SNEBB_003928 [Seison nebaliae]|nr:hypothetical protein SNEBB_003928 [Seison nebaliae]
MKLCRDCCGSFYSKQQMSQNIDKKKRAETPKYHQNLRLSSVTSLKGADEEKVMKKFKENSKQSPSRLPSIQFNNAELNNNLRTLISDSGVIRRSKIIRTKSIEGGRKRILNRSFSVLYGDENKMYSTDLLRSVHEDLQTFLQDLQRKTEQSRKLLLQQQQLNQRKNSKDFIGIFMNSVVLHLMNWLKIEKKIIQDVNNNRNMSSAMSTDSIFIISLLVLICAIVVICSSFNDLQHLFYLITSSFYFIE